MVPKETKTIVGKVAHWLIHGEWHFMPDKVHQEIHSLEQTIKSKTRPMPRLKLDPLDLKPEHQKFLDLAG